MAYGLEFGGTHASSPFRGSDLVCSALHAPSPAPPAKERCRKGLSLLIRAIHTNAYDCALTRGVWVDFGGGGGSDGKSSRDYGDRYSRTGLPGAIVRLWDCGNVLVVGTVGLCYLLASMRPFGDVAPAVGGQFKIEPGQKYVSRYRYLVTSEAADADLVNAHWKKYAQESR